MTPEFFRDNILGWRSNHPYWQAKRQYFYRAIALIPFIVMTVFAVFVAVDHSLWSSMIANRKMWFAGFGATLSAFLVILLILGLVSKWGELQRQDKIEGDPGAERVIHGPKAVFVVMILFGAGGVLPYVLATSSFLPVQVRLLFHTFAVFPLVATLLWLWFRTQKVSSGLKLKRRKLVGLLFLEILAVLALTLIHDFSLAYHKTELYRFYITWIPWYSNFEKPFLGAVVLLPTALLVYSIWELWRYTVSVSETEDKEKENTEIDDPEKLKTDNLSEVMPDWLTGLLARLPSNYSVINEPNLVRPQNTSPFVAEKDYSFVFGGVQPTRDQLNGFFSFVSHFEQVIREFESGNNQQENKHCAHLLVEGDVGSGKTTLLMSCALYAALVRGQRVLFIVPDGLRRDLMTERLGSLIKELQLNYYIHVAPVTQPNVLKWVNVEKMVYPNIFVSTPADFDELFYGGAFTAGDQFDALRRLLLLLEVVIVDDFMDLDMSVRSHLPFILDKHRLLFASEFMTVQFVVSCPRLADIGRTILGGRLFTSKNFSEKHNVQFLKPRPNGVAWRVDLGVDDIQGAEDELISLCLDCENDLDIVLFRKGLDEPQRQKQQKALRQKNNKLNISVISNPDQQLEQPADSVDAIFYQVAVHEDAYVALRMHMGHDTTVIFSIAPKGEQRQYLEYGVVPVVADRSSQSLLLSHLQSLARFILPYSPVLADSYYQLGIDYKKLSPAEGKEPMVIVFQYDEWSGVTAEGQSEYGKTLWPYVVLATSKPPRFPVVMYKLPGIRHSLFSSKGENFFFLGRLISDHKDKDVNLVRRALWRDREAQQEMREIDLVHLYEMKLIWGSTTFVPHRIESVGDEYRFVAGKWRGDGTDSYLPVFSIGWRFPAKQDVEIIFGKRANGFILINLFQSDNDTSSVSAAITSRIDDYGTPEMMDRVDFQYSASFSALILNPRKELTAAEMKNMIRSGLKGDWETGDTRFWPELTSAMNYACESRIQGLKYFSRVLAFGLSGEAAAIGTAVIFFIEPVNSGRAVLNVLDQLLRDKNERKILFKSVLWLLEKIQEIHKNKGETQHFLRRFGRLGYTGDDRLFDLEGACDLIAFIVSCSEKDLGYLPPLPEESVDPDDPRLLVTPTVTLPKPIWDIDKDITSWSNCVEQLWHVLDSKFPGLDDTIVSSWENELRFYIKFSDGNGAESIVALQGLFPDEKIECVRDESTILIMPAEGLIFLQFKEGIVRYLENKVSKLSIDSDTTLVLGIWAFVKSDTSEIHRIKLHDPLDLVIVGGFNPEGLFLASKPESVKIVPQPVIPSPEPVVSPQQTVLLPDEPVYPLPGQVSDVEGEWIDFVSESPSLDTGIEHSWNYSGKEYTVTWGLSNTARQSYFDVLDRLPARISTGSFCYYILNDPFLNEVHQLGGELFRLYGSSADSGFIEFLLAFVQNFPYVHDQKLVNGGDLPRFPSEFFIYPGGDCEDSSIMMVTLLAKFGFDSAFIDMKNESHLAVGVVGPFSGTHYTVKGKKYYYAETASNRSYRPLGMDTELSGSAEVTPYFADHLPTSAPVQVLSLYYEKGKSYCTIISRLTPGIRLTASLYARKTAERYDSSVTPICVSASNLPLQTESCQTISFELDMESSLLSPGNNWIDLVIWTEDIIVGRWVDAMRFSLERSLSPVFSRK